MQSKELKKLYNPVGSINHFLKGLFCSTLLKNNMIQNNMDLN